MLESPVYRDILEEGHEIGRQRGLEEGRQEGRKEGRKEGRQEGRQEGRKEGLRADVLAVLEVRFGSVPESLPAKISKIADLAELEALHRRAVVVDSLPAFLQELG